MPDSHVDFRALFHATPDAAVVIDTSMTIVAANEAYCAMTNRTADTLIGRFHFDAFPAEGEGRELAEDHFRRALNGEPNVIERLFYPIPDPDAPGGMRDAWWRCSHNPVRDAHGTVRYMVQNARDVTELVQAEDLKSAITAELQHRVGNILSLVSVIAKRTVATSDDLPTFLSRFQGRMQALARTHSALTGGNWNKMTLSDLVFSQLADHYAEASNQITLRGPDVHLSAVEAQTLSMALHELTTNSVKYGALKDADGALEIDWSLVGTNGYALRWSEHRLRNLKPPTRTGFGSIILDTIVPSQLKATARRNYADSSFIYELEVPQRMNATVT